VGGGGGHEGHELGQADVSVVIVGVRLLYFPPLDLDRRFQIRLSTAAARVSLLNKKNSVGLATSLHRRCRSSLRALPPGSK
jgi:hypothetical protein